MLGRNQIFSQKAIDEVLISVLDEKIDYLHAEGVANSIHGLAMLEYYDNKEIWSKLLKAAREKHFDVQHVKSGVWTADKFYELDGSENVFGRQFNAFAQDLFFQDRINLFELYNALKKVERESSIDVGDTIAHLE